MNKRNRILAVVLVVVILVAVGILCYAVAAPPVGERFTEFYILGAEGKAADYPAELKVGEEGRVIVGIVNHEHESVSYRVEMLVNGEMDGGVGPVLLKHEEKWEETVSFMPRVAGEHQKVDFFLYRQDQTDVYRALHLWVDVKDAG
jgi:uncharacterized membrane protein